MTALSEVKILVLGALGNVGAEVVKALRTQGIGVRAGDLFPEKIIQRYGNTVEAAAVEGVAFDFNQLETFEPTFQDIEKAFVLRPPQITNIQRDMIPAMDAARAAGVRYIVFLSLIGIEQNRVVPHYKVERYLST